MPPKKNVSATATVEESFLPPDYKPPVSGGNYVKLVDGENRLRILARPVLGNVGWRDDNGKRSPVRKRMGEEFAPHEVLVDAKNKIRHFWAMPVWDYAAEKVRVWELTQSTIQEAIRKLSADADWGLPLDYDIKVVKSGEGMDTEYAVMPIPKKPLPLDAEAAWAEAQQTFSLEVLFDGGDPFAAGDQRNGKTPEMTGRARFFALLDEGVKVGIWDRGIKDDSGRDARRKLVHDLLGKKVEPQEMSREEWDTVNNKMAATIKGNTPPDDSDIPF
jgi:hypothetical protein